jgi:AraC-like DNA-binding protein
LIHNAPQEPWTVASLALRAGPESLGEIAGRIGYEAEAAFSKAFKRWAGHAPGAYRQSSRMTATSSVG